MRVAGHFTGGEARPGRYNSALSAFGSLFSARYLTDSPSGLPGVFFDVYTGLLVLILLVSIYVYIRRRPLSRGVTPRRHLFRRVSQAGIWLSASGLFLALMRYLQVLYLDIRILSYLLILAAIGYCGYVAYYLSERYPVQLYQFEQVESDRRYRIASPKRRQPAPSGASGRSPIQRGKRKR